jgi:hypothetical protein
MQLPSPQIKCLLFSTNELIITEIEEVDSQIGEPDCKLTNPCVVHYGVKISSGLTPWLDDVTNQNVFMVSSDKILTLFDPKPSLLKEYKLLFP